LKESKNHVDFLDHLRGVAILAVFLFHCLATIFGIKFPWNGLVRDFSIAPSLLALLPIPACIGDAGVPIFFVVSGFCIHMSYQQSRKWGGFFARRFFRIYPPYLLAVLLLALFLPETIKIFFGVGDAGRLQVASHLLLIHNFSPDTNFGINPSFWSIAVEVQLYLLYPVLLMLVNNFGWRKTLFMLLVCQLLFDCVAGATSTLVIYPSLRPIAFAIGHYDYWLGMSPLAFWFSWALGAFIADAYLNKQPFPMAKASLISWFALAFFCYFVRPLEPFRFLLFAVVTAIAISKLLSGIRPTIRIPNFLLNHLRLTGNWSYSIYLLHQPMLVALNVCVVTFFPATNHHLFLRFWLCVISWFVIMPFGGFWYRLIERPSIAVGKRIIQHLGLSSKVG